MEFDEALVAHGFRHSDERQVGSERSRQYVATPNRFMTYSVHTYEDGTAIFSWEFALGEYLAGKGVQVGSDETLNQFAYPRTDVRGQQDGEWLAAVLEQAEALLTSVRLDKPD
jgi:GrpB-like predicted nucleotidyltransferase (UPF0157 family)